jgi:cytochrome P450
LKGSDTSALCLNFTLFLLANNPDAQKHVHDELDQIFKDRGESNLYASIEDLGEMSYLEMCIKESLRLYPPAPLIPRLVHRDIPLGSCTSYFAKHCLMDNGKRV